MLRSLFAPITKAVDFILIANVDHARQQRKLNGVLKGYSAFRKEFYDAADTAVFNDDRFNFDKWVSINELTLLFHKASCAPVHMTPYDKKQHLGPVLDRLRSQIQNGEITGYRSGDVDSLDDYYVRAARVWNAILDCDLPDGGQSHRAASNHDARTKNQEVPRPIYINGEEREEWLNVKTPLIYSLAITEDSSKRRAAKNAFKYDRVEHGNIKTTHNNPYMP